MKTKGTINGVLPTLGLVIMAALMAFQTLPISQAFAEEMSESYNDLSRITQAKSQGNFMYHNNGLLASEHAVNQKSYELGQIKGGFAWSYNTPTEQKLVEKLENESQKYLNNNYTTYQTIQDCTIPTINHTLNIQLQNKFIKFNQTSYAQNPNKPPEIICNYPETKVNYTGEKPKYGSNFEENRFSTTQTAEANRYGPLIDKVKQYTNQIKNEYPKSSSGKVEQKTGTSSTVCTEGSGITDSHKKTAMRSAVSSVEGVITGSKTEAWNTVSPIPNWMEKTVDKYNKSKTFRWGGGSPIVSTDIFSGSISTSIKDSCTNCCGTSNNYDEVYAEAKVTPSWTKYYLVLEEDESKNSHNKILTENGWKHLEFRIEPWTHSLP